MNKQLYRVIFNKARGMLVVVSEIAKSHSSSQNSNSRSKGSSEIAPKPSQPRLNFTQLAFAVLTSYSMIYAQVYAANSQIQSTAAINQANRPVLLNSTNNTPIVNIVTPNSKGVSHNIYNQFDVGSNGVVLNNSRTGANSVLTNNAIQGNAYLAKGEASTILNEVRSTKASQFDGNLEVAGQRANVIIANPSGLSINGGGFINVDRATLITGTPNFDKDGNLQSLTVTQGNVAINNGVNQSGLGGVKYNDTTLNQAKYTDIIARSIVLNGKLYSSNNLNLVTGTNTVNYTDLNTTGIKSTTTKPLLALDVSNLGSAYANSIYMVGTEQGVGVKNLGLMQAGTSLVLDNQGKIENTGTMRTVKADTGMTYIAAQGKTGDIINNGNITSTNQLVLSADHDLVLNQGIIKNTAATDVTNEGHVYVSAGNNVQIGKSQQIINDNIKGNVNIIANNAITANGGTLKSKSDINLQSAKNTSLTGSNMTAEKNATVISKDAVTVAQATITANNNLHLESASANLLADNPNSNVTVSQSTLSGGKDMVMVADHDVNLTNNQLAGDQLRSSAGNNITLTQNKDNKLNQAIYLKADNQLNIDTNNTLLQANTIEALANDLTVDRSQITTTQALNLTAKNAATIAKSSQLTSTNNDVNMTALDGNLTVTGANITAGKNIGVAAQKDLVLTVQDWQNQAPMVQTKLTSKGNTTLLAQTGDIQATAIQATAKDTLTLQAGNGITIKAIQDSAVKPNGQDYTNLATALKGGRVALSSAKADINVQQATIKATTDNPQAVNILTKANNILDKVTINTAGSVNIVSDKNTTLNNSQVTSDRHVILKADGALSSNANIKADGIVSINSIATQNLAGSNLIGGAINLASGTGINVTNATLAATGSSNADNIKTLGDSNGDVSIVNGRYLITDKKTGKTTEKINTTPRNFTLDKSTNLSVKNDLTINTTGKLTLAGKAGTQGLGSEKKVNLVAEGDINLTGGSVDIQGANISSQVNTFVEKKNALGQIVRSVVNTPSNAINITATQGNVEIGALKNTFKNKVSQAKLNEAQLRVNEQKALVEDLTKQLESSPLYQQKSQLMQKIEQIGYRLQEDSMAWSELELAQQEMQSLLEIYNESETHHIEQQLPNEKQTLGQLNQILEISKKPADGAEHSIANLTAGKDINIIAKQGILLEGTNLTSSNGGMTIYAAGNLPAEVTTKAPLKEGESWIATTPVQVNRNSIVITSLANTYQYGPVGDANSSYHQLVTNPTLTAKKDIQIVSEGKISTNLDTKPTIVPTGKLLLDDKLEVYDNTAIKFNPQTEMLSGTDLKIVKVPTGSTFINNAMILNGVDINSQQGNVLIHNKTGDIQFAAAQETFLDNSRRTYKKGHWWNRKKITETKHSQISDAIVTDITGNNINIKADGSIYAFGTQMATNNQQGNLDVSAGKKLYLYTVDSVNEQNVDVKKKSTFLGIKYSDSHTNDTRNETVELPAKLVGNKIITQSGQNTYLKGTQFEYLSDVTVQAGVGKYADPKAQVIFDSAVKQIQTASTKESNNTLWMVKEGEGGTTTTATLPSFVGPTKPQIIAPGGLVVIVGKDADKTGTVTDKRPLATVAVELSKQPGFEYLADIAKREDVDWQQIKLIQDKWEYKQEGLTPAAAALIALAVSIATGGAGTASMLGVTQGSAAHAAFISLTSKASVTLINNKGDVAKTLKDLGTSATVKELAFAAVTAGVSAKLDATVLKNVPNKALGDRFIRGIVHGTSDALLDSAVNGTNLETALKNSLRSSLLNSTGEYAATKIGQLTLSDNQFIDNLAKSIAHGVGGCIIGSLDNGDCTSRAMGSATGEVIANYLAQSKYQYKIDDSGQLIRYLSATDKQKILNISKAIVGISAAYQGQDVDKALAGAELVIINNATSDKIYKNFNGTLDDLLKNTTLEGTIAFYYGINGGITYAGNGSVTLNIAIVNGASTEIAFNKTVPVGNDGRLDGVYVEVCASAGKIIYGGVCTGSNGSNRNSYTYVKGGVGAGTSVGVATGYSKTISLVPPAKQVPTIPNGVLLPAYGQNWIDSSFGF